jgi:hypothetical protein
LGAACLPPLQCPLSPHQTSDAVLGAHYDLGALLRYEVSAILAEQPAAYEPIFMTDAGQVTVAHWAAGFMRGIGLRVAEWSPILLTDMRAKLTPIFVSHDLGAGFLPDVPSAEQRRLRPDAHQHIAAAVIALRAACNPQRTAVLEATKRRRATRR